MNKEWGYYKTIPNDWLVENYAINRMSAPECGRALKCSYATIYRALISNGIKIRTSGDSQIGKRTGEKHPRWKGGLKIKTVRQCCMCGASIHRTWNKSGCYVCKGRCRSELFQHLNGGSKCHLWHGGIGEDIKWRHRGFKYLNWRRSIFIRDDFTCQKCGKKNVYLQAHHIRNWKDNPDGRYDITNGETMCLHCHKRIHFPNKQQEVHHF